MDYTYTWANDDQTSLKRECSDSGTCVFVPTDPMNRDYAEFLASGVTAAPYVAPPTPPELTAAEKLAAAGLTVEELKELLR